MAAAAEDAPIVDAAAEARKTYVPRRLEEAWYIGGSSAGDHADPDEEATEAQEGGGGGHNDVKARADHAFLVGEYARVIELVEAWIATSKPSGAPLRDLTEAAARAAYKLGRFDKTIALLDIAPPRTPPVAAHPSQLVRARALRGLGRHADAILVVRAFLDAEQLHCVTWTLLGDLLHDINLFSLAMYCWTIAAVTAQYQKRDLPAGAFGRERIEKDEVAIAARLAALPADTPQVTTSTQLASFLEASPLESNPTLSKWFLSLPTRAEEIAKNPHITKHNAKRPSAGD